VLLITVDCSEQFHESLAEHASTCGVFLVRRLIDQRLTLSGASSARSAWRDREAGDLGEYATPRSSRAA